MIPNINQIGSEKVRYFNYKLVTHSQLLVESRK